MLWRPDSKVYRDSTRENPYLDYWDAINTNEGEHTDMMIGFQRPSPDWTFMATLGDIHLHTGDDPMHRPGDRRGLGERRSGHKPG